MMDKAERCVLHLHVRLQIYIRAATSLTALLDFLYREVLLITTMTMYRCRTSSHSQDTQCSQFTTQSTLTLSTLSVNFNTPASVSRGTLALSQMETYFLTQMKMALRSVTTRMSGGLRASPILRQQKSVHCSPVN